MKEIKNYLHLYFTSQIEVNEDDDVRAVKNVREYIDWIETDYDIKNFAPKLVLRLLSDATDEHKELIGKIIDPSKEHEDEYNGFTYSWFNVGDSFIKSYIKNEWEDDFLGRPADLTAVINKLRELEYDMDGLIESGLAINKNTLP